VKKSKAKDTRNYHKQVKKYSEGGAVTDDDGYAEPLPDTDDNMFLASGRDEKIIRAKRTLRDRARYGDNGYNVSDARRETQNASDRFRGKK
jgi:hypothetical protein